MTTYVPSLLVGTSAGDTNLQSSPSTLSRWSRDLVAVPVDHLSLSGSPGICDGRSRLGYLEAQESR